MSRLPIVHRRIADAGFSGNFPQKKNNEKNYVVVVVLEVGSRGLATGSCKYSSSYPDFVYILKFTTYL